MKRSLNSASLDASSDGVEVAPLRPSPSELGGETQGPRIDPVAWSARVRQVSGDSAQVPEGTSGRRGSSSGRSRHRRHRRVDPWESYVRDNWIPTLEHTFGPDWRRHCPGEVAALIWWAIASRAGFAPAAAAAEASDLEHSRSPPVRPEGSPEHTGTGVQRSRRQANVSAAPAAAPARSSTSSGLSRSPGMALPLHALLLPLSAESLLTPGGLSGAKAETAEGVATAERCSIAPQAASAVAAQQQHVQRGARLFSIPTLGSITPQHGFSLADAVGVAANSGNNIGASVADLADNGASCGPLTVFAAVVAAPILPDMKWTSSRQDGAPDIAVTTTPQSNPQQGVRDRVTGGDGVTPSQKSGAGRSGGGEEAADGGRVNEASDSGATGHVGANEAGPGASANTPSGVGSAGWDATEEADLLFMLQQGLEARLAVQKEQYNHSAGDTKSVVEPALKAGAAGGDSTSGTSIGASDRTLPVLDLSRPYLSRTDGSRDDRGSSRKGQRASGPCLEATESRVAASALLGSESPRRVLESQPSIAASGLGTAVAGRGLPTLPEVACGSTVFTGGNGDAPIIGEGVDALIGDSGSGGGTSRDSKTFVLNLDPTAFPIALSGEGPFRTLLSAVSSAIATATTGCSEGTGAGVSAGELPALAAALFPSSSAWPARVLLPPDSTLTLSAPADASKTYNMQLPDGSIVPVQLVPLPLSLGGVASEGAGNGGRNEGGSSAAASAAALVADDLSSLMAASAAAMGGWRPLSELLNRSDPQGRLPLHAAAATGRVEMVERLLALGCDAGRRLDQDFIHGGSSSSGAVNDRPECDYDCASSGSSSYPDNPDEDDSDDAHIIEAARLGARCRRSTDAGIGGAEDGPGGSSAGTGGITATAVDNAGGAEGYIDDAASGASFSDSDDMAFGADDGSPSTMSVAQAARLGLHIALDTCGDRLTPDQLHFLAGKFAEQQLWKSTAAALMPTVAPGCSIRANPAQAVTSGSAGGSLRPSASYGAKVAAPTVHFSTSAGCAADGLGPWFCRGKEKDNERKGEHQGPADEDLAGSGDNGGRIEITPERDLLRQEGAAITLGRSSLCLTEPANELTATSRDLVPLVARVPSPVPDPELDVPPAVARARAVQATYGDVASRVGRLDSESHGNEQQQQQVYQQPSYAGDAQALSGSAVLQPTREDVVVIAGAMPILNRQAVPWRHGIGERRKRHGESPERIHDEQQAGGDEDDTVGINGDDIVAPPITACAIAGDSADTHNGSDYVPSGGGDVASTLAGTATVTCDYATAAEAVAGVPTGVVPRRRPRRVMMSAARGAGQQQMYDDPRVRGFAAAGCGGRNKRQADGDAADVCLVDGEGEGGLETGLETSVASAGGGSVGVGGAAEGSGACQRDGVTSCHAPVTTAGALSAGAITGGGVGGGTWMGSSGVMRNFDRRPAATEVGTPAPPLSGPKHGEYGDHDGGVNSDNGNNNGGDDDSNPDIDIAADVEDADLQGFGVALLDGLGALPLPLPLGLSNRRFRRGRVPPPFAARPSYVGALPLHLAAAHGHLAVCEVLLRASGCDLAARTAQGRTALHLAARNGHEAVVALLLRTAAAAAAAAASVGPATSSPVGASGAAAQSHLLAEVVDVADKEGHTALHHAAALGHWRVVEELWPRGASIDAADGYGCTPLHYAAMAGHVETAGRLIIAGAGVHRLDCDGYTPAHYAAMRGHAEVLEKLLLAGFEVDLLGGPSAGIRALPASSLASHGAAELPETEPGGQSEPRRYSSQPAVMQDQQQQKHQMEGSVTTRDVPTRPSLRPLQKQPTHSPESSSPAGRQQQVSPLTGSRVAASGGGSGGHTALHLAASGGHCAAIAVLLQHGGSAERRDWRGCTALHRAAEGGHRGAFELLLMHGADPRVTDLSGASVLHSAARGGNLAIVQRLLDLDLEGKGDSGVAGRSSGGRSHSANSGLGRKPAEQKPFRDGATAAVKDQPQDTSVDANAAGMTPRPEQDLSDPAGSGGRNAVWVVNPAAPASDGRLPLHWAAAAGRDEVVAWLLQLETSAGGNPLRQDHSGATPWHLAAAAGQESSIRVFLTPPSGISPVPVDARDGAGRTALHRAASAGSGSVVALLLSAGADPAAADDGGRTSLHYAAEAGLVGVMRLLLEHVAAEDVDRRDASGWSALHHAAEQGNAAMLQLLLHQGACPHSATAHGWTPAHLAARGHHVDLLADLLTSGADPRVRDVDGCTPLHFAALRGDEELFARLLSAAAAAGDTGSDTRSVGSNAAPLPASLALRDARGYTLLHYAVEGCNLNIIRRLLAAGLSEAEEVEALAMETMRGPGEVTKSSHATSRATMPFGVGVFLPSSVLQGRFHTMPELRLSSCPMQQDPGSTVAGEVQPSDLDATSISAAVLRPAVTRAPLSALHLAAKLCRTDVVQILLASGYSAASRTTDMDQTPLHFAAMGPVRTPIETRRGIAAADSASMSALPEALRAEAAGSPNGTVRPKTPAALQLGAPQPPYPQHKQQRLDGASGGADCVVTASVYHSDQMQVVDALMAAGADPLVTDAWGCTALSYAAGSGNHALVARLLALGCDPLKADRRGLTPLHWGAAGGCAEVVAALLAAGGSGGVTAPPTERLASLDCLGRTPLHWAAEAGSLGCVAVLTGAMLASVFGSNSSNGAVAGAASAGTVVTAAADLLHAPDAGGCSAAQLAAAGGHVDVVARLLEAGAGRSLAAADAAAAAAGLSALHLAAQAGLEQVVAQLLCLAQGSGVEVNARDAEGFTPLHAAATRGSAPIAARLIRAGADPNIASTEGLLPLHAAAAGGHLDVVELLLDTGSLVSYKSSGGATPLHQAASNGHAVLCEVLLEAGCPVMGRLASGASALYCAASAGWEDVVEVLLRAGAEVDAGTTSGCTALHGAATNGHTKVISMLLAEGADSDLQSSNGHTPLHNAAGGGHVAAVGILLVAGADVDAQNSNGNTPLHTAASKGYLDAVSQLLSGGADLHIRNSKGWCAVHSAASNGYFEVVLKLVQAGASWRRQGEADVVRLLTRKTTYKTSYVEGRLRLAERERHRNNQQQQQQQQQQAGAGRQCAGAGPMMLTAASGAVTVAGAAGAAAGAARAGEAANLVAEGAVGAAGRQKGAVPTSASFEDLAAAADANMAALLEEEAAAAAAAVAVAERKAKQKKKKANKAACKSASAVAPSGTALESSETSAASSGMHAQAKQDGDAQATGVNAKEDEDAKAGIGSVTRALAVSQGGSCDVARTSPPHSASAAVPPGDAAVGAAFRKAMAAPAADSTGSCGGAASTAATGRAANATATSPKTSAASGVAGAGQRQAKSATAAASGGGRGASVSSSAMASPLEGRTRTILRSSVDGPPTANGPTIGSGTGPGLGSKAKGQSAISNAPGNSTGTTGIALRAIDVKSLSVDSSEGGPGSLNGLVAVPPPAAVAAQVDVKKGAGPTTSGMSTAKAQYSGKRGASANSPGNVTGTALAGGTRMSAAHPAGVEATQSGKHAAGAAPAVAGTLSPRQRAANREAAGGSTHSHVNAMSSAPALASDPSTAPAGSKTARIGNGGKGAGGQSTAAWQPHRGAEVTSPSVVTQSSLHARTQGRNGPATMSSIGAGVGSSSPAAISQPSTANMKPVTLAQVVAGSGKHGGPIGGGSNRSNSSSIFRKPMASGTLYSAGHSALGTAASAGPTSCNGSAAGYRPAAGMGIVPGPGLGPSGHGGPIEAVGGRSNKGPAAANLTGMPVQGVGAAAAEVSSNQHPPHRMPSAPALQQRQPPSSFILMSSSGGGLGPGPAAGPGMSAPAHPKIQGPLSLSQLPAASTSPHIAVTQLTQTPPPPSEGNSTAQLPTRPQPHLQSQPHPHPPSHLQRQQQHPQSSNAGAGGGGVAAFQGFTRSVPPSQPSPGYSPIAESLRLGEPSNERCGYPQLPLGLSASQSFRPVLSQGTGQGLGAGGFLGGPSYPHAMVSGAQYGHVPGPVLQMGGSERAAGPAGFATMAVGAIRASHPSNHSYRPTGTGGTGCNSSGVAGMTPSSATAATAATARQMLPSRPAASQPVSPIRMYSAAHENGGGAGVAGFDVCQGMSMLPQGLPHNDWPFGGVGGVAAGNSSGRESLPPSLGGSSLHAPPPSSPMLHPSPATQAPIFGSEQAGHLMSVPGYLTVSASSPTPPPGIAPTARPPPPPPPMNSLHSGLGLRSSSGSVIPPGGLQGFVAAGATWTAVRAINSRDAAGTSSGGQSTSAPSQQRSPGMTSPPPPPPPAAAGDGGGGSSATGSASTAGVAMPDLSWSRYPAPWNTASATVAGSAAVAAVAAVAAFSTLDPTGSTASNPTCSGGGVGMSASGGFFRTGSSVALHGGVMVLGSGGDTAPPGNSPARSGSASSLRASVGLGPSASAATASSLLAGSGSIWSIKPSEAAGGLGSSALLPSAFTPLSGLNSRLHTTRETSPLNPASTAANSLSTASSTGGGAPPLPSSTHSSLEPLRASSRGSSSGDGSGAGGAFVVTSPQPDVTPPVSARAGEVAAGGGSSTSSTTASSYSFHCPLTRKVMRDPVVAADGFTYEREAILAWMQTHIVSPLTGEKLCSRDVVPNWTMRAAIQLLARQ